MLDVGDQVRRRVRIQAPQRPRPSRATLIEDHDAPMRRIEKPPVHRTGASAWPTVKEQDRPPTRIADLLPIHHVAIGQRQIAGLERPNLRKQVAARHVRQIYFVCREVRPGALPLDSRWGLEAPDPRSFGSGLLGRSPFIWLRRWPRRLLRNGVLGTSPQRGPGAEPLAFLAKRPHPTHDEESRTPRRSAKG